MFTRCDTIHERDRRTDGQTDTTPWHRTRSHALCISSCGKYWAESKRRATFTGDGHIFGRKYIGVFFKCLNCHLSRQTSTVLCSGIEVSENVTFNQPEKYGKQICTATGIPSSNFFGNPCASLYRTLTLSRRGFRRNCQRSSVCINFVGRVSKASYAFSYLVPFPNVWSTWPIAAPGYLKTSHVWWTVEKPPPSHKPHIYSVTS